MPTCAAGAAVGQQAGGVEEAQRAHALLDVLLGAGASVESVGKQNLAQEGEALEKGKCVASRGRDVEKRRGSGEVWDSAAVGQQGWGRATEQGGRAARLCRCLKP